MNISFVYNDNTKFSIIKGTLSSLHCGRKKAMFVMLVHALYIHKLLMLMFDFDLNKELILN